MSEAVLRSCMILGLIPVEPRRVTADQILGALQRAGLGRVSIRTIQHDLDRLSQRFPIVSDDRSKPYGWSWSRDGRVFDAPAIDPSTALTLKLIERHLAPMLPREALQRMARFFEAAGNVLDAAEPGIRSWPDRLRTLSWGPGLQSAPVAAGVLDVVYDALLSRRRFECTYRPRQPEPTDRKFVVNPVALVLREPAVYLVATLWDYDDLRHLALHRMSDATMLDEPAIDPPGFDLDAYLANGPFDYPVGGPIRLEMFVDAAIARHLEESRLSDDQQLAPELGGRVRVHATVLDTQQLAWWLLGFGPGVEVLAPVELRQRIAQTLRAAADRYGP